MEWYMKIIGAKLVHQSTPDDGIMEITMTPYEPVKKKPMSFMDLASGGIERMITETQANVPRLFVVYMPLLDWIKEFKNQPLSNVSLIMKLDRSAIEIGLDKKDI